jgi:hypothetical protein
VLGGGWEMWTMMRDVDGKILYFSVEGAGSFMFHESSFGLANALRRLQTAHNGFCFYGCGGHLAR